MPTITVQLYTTIGKKLVKEKISTDAANVAQALNELERRLGRDFRKELYEEDGTIRDHYIVSLNGYPVDRKNPESVQVSENDILLIYAAVSGG